MTPFLSAIYVQQLQLHHLQQQAAQQQQLQLLQQLQQQQHQLQQHQQQQMRLQQPAELDILAVRVQRFMRRGAQLDPTSESGVNPSS